MVLVLLSTKWIKIEKRLLKNSSLVLSNDSLEMHSLNYAPCISIKIKNKISFALYAWELMKDPDWFLNDGLWNYGNANKLTPFYSKRQMNGDRECISIYMVDIGNLIYAKCACAYVRIGFIIAKNIYVCRSIKIRCNASNRGLCNGQHIHFMKLKWMHSYWWDKCCKVGLFYLYTFKIKWSIPVANKN